IHGVPVSDPIDRRKVAACDDLLCLSAPWICSIAAAQASDVAGKRVECRAFADHPGNKRRTHKVRP
ncbi:hypothetical protein, partial [Stutzerimonas balearica]|uniref:hypothetical protein n=1 Tax=Stutzerimonas balearica TaxID=74829 RepID=UPI0028B1C1C3